MAHRSGAMQAALPATRYPVPAFPDLANQAERERLTAPALRAFFKIMKLWSVRDEDARLLLNGVSNGTFYTWKKGAAKTLDQDRLLRISYLIGIFKSLNILFSPELADCWVRLPNTNDLFAGRSPLEMMLRGGTPGMDVVRCLLDARRGG